MTATADQRLTAGVVAALREGPLDVLGLLEVLRPVLAEELARREGGLHALLHQLLRRDLLAVDGCTERGLARYLLREEAPDGRSPAVPGAPSPADHLAREGARFGDSVRRPEDRARIAADVAAHLRNLGDGQRSAFGPSRTARHLLRRVDRGRPTVIFAVQPWEGFKRFVLHEGPWLLTAVVVFFVVRAFLAEVFVIPSGSMIPTLLPKDRVIVVKPGGSGMPRRWTIATFERNGITFVKRAVGLGGEAFALVDGDVYADGQIVAKPDEVREALRFPYREWDLQDEEDLADWARTEDPEGGATWTWNGPPLWSAGILHPRRPTSDVLLRDAYAVLTVDRPAGASVSLALEYAMPGDVTTGDEEVFVLRVTDAGANLTSRVGEAGRGFSPDEDGPPPAPGRVDLSLSYVDGILRARAGGLTFRAEVSLAPGRVVRPRIRASARIRLLDLRLDKDIHYSRAGELAVPGHVSDEAPGSYAFPIPEDHVFFLGDNTHDSRDSRFRTMGPVPADALIGPVSLRIWPLSRIGFVR